MITGQADEVANRMQHTVRQGFEVYIYTIEPNPLGQITHFPQGVLNLRRVYHLYNAHEEYHDQVQSILEGLSQHSQEASLEYLDMMIAQLNAEKEGLKVEINPEQPSQESPTTGS